MVQIDKKRILYPFEPDNVNFTWMHIKCLLRKGCSKEVCFDTKKCLLQFPSVSDEFSVKTFKKSENLKFETKN